MLHAIASQFGKPELTQMQHEESGCEKVLLPLL